MKIPPQPFFNFCGNHVLLLKAVMEYEGEASEADVRRLIRETSDPEAEQTDTTWRRLTEFQIILPTESNRDFYFMADPVRRLLAYLFDEANAATPEIIQGYIHSLEALNRQLSRSIQEDDPPAVLLALEELQQTIRRIQNDLDETHRCILSEVGRYKVERPGVSIRDKFRRIAYWMDRYVDPLVNMVRPDGPLQATFDETERLLNRARVEAVNNDVPRLERNLRNLRNVERYALRVFQQCRRELQPLYESLRRASFIAHGAAIALERLQREGIENCPTETAFAIFLLRWQNVPSETALHRAVANVAGYRPEPPPVLSLDSEEDIPASYARRLWLDTLPSEAKSELPIPDVLGWLLNRYPDLSTEYALAGFTCLFFDNGVKARFTDDSSRCYETRDGAIEAHPLELSTHE